MHQWHVAFVPVGTVCARIVITVAPDVDVALQIARAHVGDPTPEVVSIMRMNVDPNPTPRVISLLDTA